MKKETTTYQNALVSLRSFYRQHHRMPSFAELGDLVGLRSKNAVSKLVRKLEENNVVRRDHTGRLVPNRLEDNKLRVLGAVEAGFPADAEEQLLDTITIDEWLIDNKEATFILHVVGESMKDAGIREGDMVIVERGRSPRVGDIVIAEVDGAWTMKYYRKKNGRVWLEPANEAFEAIYPKEELKIEAVVVGVVRKY